MTTRMLVHTLRLMLLAAVMVTLGACATTGAAEGDDEPADALPQPADVRLSDYEDFDVSAYPEAPPEEEVLEHDVPDVLMEGRASDGVARVVQGFRIQIASSVEKDEAVAAEEQLRRWWQLERESSPRGVLPHELPTYVVFRQPYYRVRVGNFVSRADAAAALAVVESRFPGSFIVPDAVTIRGE